MTETPHTPEVRRVLRYAGNCEMTECHRQARFLVIDAARRRHFLCPGHKDAAVAALAQPS